MSESTGRVGIVPSVIEGGEKFAWLATARWTLIALLMAAPLTFGAVQAWAWGAMSAVSVLILVLWAFHCVSCGSAKLVRGWLYVPGVVLIAFTLMQLFAHWTLDPAATREAAIKLATYLLLFFLGQQIFAEATSRQWLSAGLTITIYGLAVALFAIIQFFASPGVLYGLLKPRWNSYIFGPYVSHNNYAGLMEMLIPIAVSTVLTLRQGHPARPFSLFAVLICVVSVLLSGSRGGVISLVAEFVVLGLIVCISPTFAELRGRALAAALALLTIAGGLFLWLDPGDVWKRWEIAADSPSIALEDRGRMTVSALRMSRANLVYGVGIGAFETAYPRYQTIATELLIDHAHNDYAQFVAEAGLLGWLLIPLSSACFCWLAFRRLGARCPAQQIGWLQVGAALGVCGILVHSFSDFNLHIPANAAWFAVVAALAVLGRQPLSLKSGAEACLQNRDSASTVGGQRVQVIEG